MPIQLTPSETTPRIALPTTGTYSDVSSIVPYEPYRSDSTFISGAVDQVTLVYYSFSGPILDIELTPAQVYMSFSEAAREYSMMINNHQASNILLSALGYSTGTFDQDGELTAGTDISRKYPRFDFGYARRIASAYSSEAGVGGDFTMYSGSITIVSGQQDYNLQELFEADPTFSSLIDGKKILVREVYYRTPASMWRYFGFYGHFSSIGNFNSYGQYADDSTFYLVPVWQNKLQAMAYEDALWTRTSHFSFEVVNNWLRLWPIPSGITPAKIWVRFMIPSNSWEEQENSVNTGIDGVNNVNTLPFANIPYTSINSMGKQWIRNYSLALCRMYLGMARSKYDRIPLPKGDVVLDGKDLVSQAREDLDKLKTQLKEYLDTVSYNEITKKAKEDAENSLEIFKNVPLKIIVG